VDILALGTPCFSSAYVDGKGGKLEGGDGIQEPSEVSIVDADLWDSECKGFESEEAFKRKAPVWASCMLLSALFS